MANVLYYGDNLQVLRESIADESVDLIYLDPPFNSKATYNILFGGNGQSEAQIRAFDDTWHWGDESERCYADVMQLGGKSADVLEAFRQFLGENDVMAYLTMMAVRLIELHRVLKLTGGIYLHCDPTAGHYLKILMDAVFGAQNFVNEIVWKRTSAHSDYVQGAKHFGRIHDTILFYCKDSDRPWNPVLMPYDKDYVERIYRYKDPDGRRYQTQPLHAAKPGGDTLYEWKGHHPPPGRYWAFSKENMQKLDDEGRIHYSRTGVPRYKIYLDESKGVAAQDMWTDIPPVHNLPSERLGYPTQKPVALLERIILSSSNEGDTILDPFCGCGTAIHAAQKLDRHWIGIDITHLSIGLIEYRLRDAFGIRPEVIGAPEDLAGAHDLFDRDPFQFEAWAVTRLLGIKPNERQTGDKGIDGVGRFYLGRDGKGREQYGKILVSVKGGRRLGVSMVRDFRGAMERDEVDLGVFICLRNPTRGMIREAAGAGRYRDLEGHDFPRIQIYTVTDYFDGKRPELPPAIEDARRRAQEESGEQHKLI